MEIIFFSVWQLVSFFSARLFQLAGVKEQVPNNWRMTAGTKDFCTIYRESIAGLKRFDPHRWSLWSRRPRRRFSALGCFDPASADHPKLAAGAHSNQTGPPHSSVRSTTGTVILAHFSHWLSCVWLIGSAWGHKNCTCCFVKIRGKKVSVLIRGWQISRKRRDCFAACGDWSVQHQPTEPHGCAETHTLQCFNLASWMENHKDSVTRWNQVTLVDNQM